MLVAPVSLPPGKPFYSRNPDRAHLPLQKNQEPEGRGVPVLSSLYQLCIFPFPAREQTPRLAGMSPAVLKGRKSFPGEEDPPQPLGAGQGGSGSTVKPVCHQKATSLVPCPRLLTFPSGILPPDPGIINPGAAR